MHRLLLDVSSLMYRAFFAWGQELRSPGGRPVGALHGYLDMTTRLLVTRRPAEVVHVYDHEWRPVARTDMYAGYKANRAEDPEDLPEQFPMLRQVLDLTGMSQAMTRGWEAEDAIGAICASAGTRDRIAILRGDASDALPGVRGVGEKTARALVQTYGSLDELLEDARSSEPRPGPLKGKPALRARLVESADYVATMQRLVPVNAIAPVDRWRGERDD